MISQGPLWQEREESRNQLRLREHYVTIGNYSQHKSWGDVVAHITTDVCHDIEFSTWESKRKIEYKEGNSSQKWSGPTQLISNEIRLQFQILEEIIEQQIDDEYIDRADKLMETLGL